MLACTFRFVQEATLICRMDVSCITTQQMVYEQVAVLLSASKSEIQYLSYLLFCHNNPDWNNMFTRKECIGNIRMAHHRVGNHKLPQCHLVAHVAYLVEVSTVLVTAVCLDLDEVQTYSGTSIDRFILCPAIMEWKAAIRWICYETLPGVCPSQPSPCYVLETQSCACSLPWLQCKVS